ncbi:hypothetical protein GGX14DRAFT_389716 [Mycena pura]|uniref:Uncharacterized protein n=1 Tax=Mycena pura TaxID=153505 RepID=A0AAD6VR68_9AGAR|nr:hypothetical protein GGX14DRAFT_389716 [Mycena pura]
MAEPVRKGFQNGRRDPANRNNRGVRSGLGLQKLPHYHTGAARWAPWPYFHQCDKPNEVHFRAAHWHCIDTQQPKDEPIDVEASADVKLKMAEQVADGAQEGSDDNFTGATALEINPQFTLNETALISP